MPKGKKLTDKGKGKGEAPKPKVPRVRWSVAEEQLLLNIINTGDKGTIKKVLVDQSYSTKLAPYDAWERVM